MVVPYSPLARIGIFIEPTFFGISSTQMSVQMLKHRYRRRRNLADGVRIAGCAKTDRIRNATTRLVLNVDWLQGELGRTRVHNVCRAPQRATRTETSVKRKRPNDTLITTDDNVGHKPITNVHMSAAERCVVANNLTRSIGSLTGFNRTNH